MGHEDIYMSLILLGGVRPPAAAAAPVEKVDLSTPLPLATDERPACYVCGEDDKVYRYNYDSHRSYRHFEDAPSGNWYCERCMAWVAYTPPPPAVQPVTT
jgi:hypothetical protein